MGMKKRNKVSAEFSMSSLTDIIFLLLIFFMLTSSAIQVNIDIPTATSKTVAPTSIQVQIEKNGRMSLNGSKITQSKLLGRVNSLKREQENKENATIMIIAEKGVPWSKVQEVMTIAATLKMKAIIATQPPKT